MLGTILGPGDATRSLSLGELLADKSSKHTCHGKDYVFLCTYRVPGEHPARALELVSTCAVHLASHQQPEAIEHLKCAWPALRCVINMKHTLDFKVSV